MYSKRSCPRSHISTPLCRNSPYKFQRRCFYLALIFGAAAVMYDSDAENEDDPLVQVAREIALRKKGQGFFRPNHEQDRADRVAMIRKTLDAARKEGNDFLTLYRKYEEAFAAWETTSPCPRHRSKEIRTQQVREGR